MTTSITGFTKAGTDTEIALKVGTWFRPEQFGAVGDGTTDDTAALTAMFAAVPSTGARVSLSKKYKVTAGLTCNNPVVIVGIGGHRGDTSTIVSGFVTATDAIDVLKLGGGNGQHILRDFGVFFTGTLNSATAGSGVRLADSGGGDFADLDNVHISGFWNCLRVDAGFYYHVNKCHFIDFVNAGAAIANSEGVDKGDMSFNDSIFMRRQINSPGGKGIDWTSGGGLRVTNCKFNANNPGWLGDAISINCVAGSTSVFVISGNSFENYNGAAVRVQVGSGANVDKVIVSSNEFLARGTGASVVVDGTGGADSVEGVVVADNVFTGSAAVALTQVDGAAIVGNTGKALATPLTISKCTGVVQLGNVWPTGAVVRDTYDWDRAFAPPVSDDTPTVAVATTGAITGGTAVVPVADYYGDTHYRYDGCSDVQSAGTNLVKAVQPSANSDGAVYTLVPEFVTSQGCDKVDLLFNTNGAGTSMGVRVTVNGKWVSLPLQWFTTTASSTWYVRLTFPSAKSRAIRVETTNTGNFGGVIVPSGETVTRPPREVRKRMVILGDSYASGANSNTTSDPNTNGASSFETFPNYVAKLLGCDSVINLGVGGTGWGVIGASHTTFGTRVSDILSANPHIVLAAGSRNDVTVSAGTVYAATLATLNQLSDVPIIEVTGIEDAGSTSGTSATSLNEAVKQGSRAAGRHFIDTLNTVTTALKNSGDNVHPSIIGHQVLAATMYASMTKTEIDAIVAAAVSGRTTIGLALTSSPSNTASTGVNVTFTATQSAAQPGKITFYVDGTAVSTSTVSGSTASYSTTTLALGAHTITAKFVPINPFIVKPVTSAPLTFTVAANLGFTDSFNRADGALTTTDNGKSYTLSGTSTTWATVSNKLMNQTIASGTSYAVVDAGESDGTLQVTIAGTTPNAAILALRYNSSNNMLKVAVQSSQIVLQQTVGGTTTTLFTGSGGGWAAGDVIAVVLNGSSITVKKNGTAVTGLNGVTTTQFQTNTLFGVGLGSTGTAVTFDDLSFV